MIVIGDSHMTPSRWKQWENTHFSEVIGKELNYNILHFGKGGMSNGGIAIALNTALKTDLNPDLILFGNTTYDRMEWPYGEKGCRYPPTIKDIKYHCEVNLTHNLPMAGDDPRIVSSGLMEVTRHIDLDLDTWEPSASSTGDPYATERLDALKKYFEFLYDDQLKRFLDEQITYAMFHRLLASGTKFVICRDQLNVYNEYRCWKWLDAKYYAWKNIMPMVKGIDVDGKDPGYHTDTGTQVKIAELLLDKYLPNL